MANQLEEELKAAIGHFVGIRVMYPDGERDYHDGVLEKVTQECIIVRSIVTHIINRHVAQIIELQVERSFRVKPTS